MQPKQKGKESFINIRLLLTKHKGHSYQIMTLIFLYFVTLIINIDLKYFKVLAQRAITYG